MTHVSPVQAATVGTGSSNSFPFNSTTVRRYLQLHGDLGAGAKIINKLAWRQICGTGAGGGARTMVLDLYVGTGRPVRNTQFNFDANYTSPKTQVLTMQTVNWGPVGPQSPCPTPSPFETAMSLPISPAFVFVGTGTNSFIWEVAVHSNTGGSIPTQLYATTNVAGTSSITAPGCGTMAHGATLYDHGGILSMNFTVSAGPPSAPSVLALGATNPALNVPGLCAPLLTDMALVLPIGVLSATGTITTAQAEQSTFVLSNILNGGTLFSQVHSLDMASTFPIPVASSNGRSTLAPAAGTNPGLIARVLNSAGGVTATSGIYFATSSVGYGLVTEITYQ